MTESGTEPASTLAARCLRGRCPHCEKGGLLRDWFHVQARCPVCGVAFPVMEGAFLGSMAINYGMIVFAILPLWLLLWWGNGWSTETLAWGALLLAVLGPIALYPLAWRLWIALASTLLREWDTED